MSTVLRRGKPPRFANDVLATARDGMVVGIRAGKEPHRIIGIWCVVVEGRVFVRSWSRTPGGWWRSLRDDPRGVVAVNGREFPARAIQTRSERLKDAVDNAYREKYRTPGSVKYVRDLCRAQSRDTTTELVPVIRQARARR